MVLDIPGTIVPPVSDYERRSLARLYVEVGPLKTAPIGERRQDAAHGSAGRRPSDAARACVLRILRGIGAGAQQQKEGPERWKRGNERSR
jgi:hypothetical protein